MMARWNSLTRWLRAILSRSEWAIRCFGLSRTKDAASRPGLVMIQIDGLSHAEMQRAVAAGRMPFLSSLLEREDYHAHHIYAGLPSSTPAAQAELFYGTKHAVPAFCYYDKKAARIFSMFEGPDAREIEARLNQSGEAPLLKGGSAYADIYTGGADEAHFCMTQLGWPDVFQKSAPLKVGLLTLLHIPSLVRIIVLFAVECVLALFDLLKGLIHRHNFWAELKFIPARVAVCIVMREIMVIRAGIDLMRGLPIVHMNFLGYDEQAHRRGPDSLFAHWSLKGIDHAIKRIYRAAYRSTRRDYDVWIYSDHGQTPVTSYQTLHGETVQAAVSRVFDKAFSCRHTGPCGIQLERARMLNVKRRRPETQPPDRLPIVTALGPLGQIYLGPVAEENDLSRMAERLAGEAAIPLVMTASGKGRATAWTAEGKHELPRDAAAVLGTDHPFLHMVADDLVELCHHPDAGDFLIAGWENNQSPLSFAIENGAHGGPSPGETAAFAVLPHDAPLSAHDDGTKRLSDIRHAAQILLAGREKRARTPSRNLRRLPKTLRLLTYNVHSCMGTDGTVSPHRIARVIERENPDIIALQEVDVHRERTQAEDQAQLLAHYLDMDVHFHPALQIEKEQYGEAVLSRFPMSLRRADALPYHKHWLVNEPRGALWVEFEMDDGRRLQLVNTHLGLGHIERRRQAASLLAPDWLGSVSRQDAAILCGDLNSVRGSYVHRLLCTRFRDVQQALSGHRPLHTFPGHHPFGSVDHIFTSDHVSILAVRVPQHRLARVASDHLPLVVDLRILDPNE
jgi:endonuclease/exonuclease/phosphatase family metal-dependent hydrolase